MSTLKRGNFQPWMVPFFFLMAGLIAWAVWFEGLFPGSGDTAGDRHLQDLPEFALADDSGKKFSQADIRGKVAVIHFWAAWCAPCIDEIPKWTAFAQRYQDRKDQVRFVAISLDPTWQEAHKILPPERLPAEVLSLLDPEQKTSEAFGSFQFPESYLVSRGGKILMKWVGPQNWEAPQLAAAIDIALSSGK